MKTVLFFYLNVAALAGFQGADDCSQWLGRGKIQLLDRDYVSAAASYQRAVRLAERSEPRGSQLLDALQGSAFAHAQMGRLAEAERGYQRALAVAAARGSKESPVYASLLTNLAGVELERGRLATASALLEESTGISLRASPVDVVQLAVARQMLSRIFVRNRAYGRAEQLMTQSIPLLQPRPELLVVTLADLGALHRLQGRHEEAANELTNTLATFEKVDPLEHPMLLPVLNKVAVEYSILGRIADAASTFQRAISILDRSNNNDPRITVVIFFNYAAFLRRTGDRANAKVYETRAASIRTSLPIDVSMLEPTGARRK